MEYNNIMRRLPLFPYVCAPPLRTDGPRFRRIKHSVLDKPKPRPIRPREANRQIPILPKIMYQTYLLETSGHEKWNMDRNTGKRHEQTERHEGRHHTYWAPLHTPSPLAVASDTPAKIRQRGLAISICTSRHFPSK